jgi:hypothetical protein
MSNLTAVFSITFTGLVYVGIAARRCSSSGALVAPMKTLCTIFILAVGVVSARADFYDDLEQQWQLRTIGCINAVFEEATTFADTTNVCKGERRCLATKKHAITDLAVEGCRDQLNSNYLRVLKERAPEE